MFEDECEDKEYLENKIAIEGDEEVEDGIDILKNEIISFVGNFSLPDYKLKLDKKIFIKPEFQRNEVWNFKQKSKLIESFLASYPVPPVILYKQKGEESYLIIDGFQRISTIYSYYNNEFKLLVFNESLKNKFYNELSDKAKNKLDNSFLHCTIVREIEPKNNSKIFLYNLFERLNTGGKTLNAMETRRALSYGKLIKELEKLNEDRNWRLIYGKNEPDNRYLDLELLIRLYAFFKKFDRNKYELKKFSSMRIFLDEFVNSNAEEGIGNFENIFKKTTKIIIENLGENPFILHSKRANYLILDSIMSSILILHGDISCLKVKFDNIMEKYRDYFEDKSGTLSRRRVEERLKFVLKELKNE
ncbi:MAG: DUF262 domain-containing protein [Candidatus Muirbacterium halophilum]|nr:DUF262 domain-containing protein [Candidatus Muirbacterium halophilum]MCK9476514.1 DUF262 domain-containing protein [Candidatus Muirbacterium halophilum]